MTDSGGLPGRSCGLLSAELPGRPYAHSRCRPVPGPPGRPYAQSLGRLVPGFGRLSAQSSGPLSARLAGRPNTRPPSARLAGRPNTRPPSVRLAGRPNTRPRCHLLIVEFGRLPVQLAGRLAVEFPGRLTTQLADRSAGDFE
ncbi:hypothetical protein ACQPYK_05720 [Streptosporangium sp. CA-135522]|uniref:hypothetical protein n=1 Tax=Streptosporangium sp. CA-135522 TaxID=3240072 RepID=UPI003D8CAA29